MTPSDIAKLRLHNQHIAGPKFKKPEDVVRHLGAMQAQDYLGALWAVGLRMEKASEASIERALADRKMIRTWPMRSTLHFVAAEDARWMLDLMTPRVLAAYAYRMRYHGITHTTYEKARTLFATALRGGRQLAREELYSVLDKGGVLSKKNGLGLHILSRLAHEQLICFGPRHGKQQTFVLLDEWVPRPKRPMSRDAALKELAIRYFTGHGPAQVQDLAWWSGLPMSEVREGIESAGSRLAKREVEGKTYYMAPNPPRISDSRAAHLLPAFDEFLVAYRDRNVSLESVHAKHINPGANGMLNPIVVVNGQVIGTWKRVIKKDAVRILPASFTKFTPTETRAIETAGNAYRKFLYSEA